MSESQGGSESESGISWIDRFLGLPGHDLFARIDEEFIEDQFNLTGLKKVVEDYQEALNVILDSDGGAAYEESAALLYGLIHARFITTAHGLQLMATKYERAEFGRCRRYLCFGNALLPLGLVDTPNEDTVKLFCPRCQELYQSDSTLDGAFFGTSSTPMLLLANPHYVNGLPRGNFELKIYGFKIHPTAFLAKPSSSDSTVTPAAPRIGGSEASEIHPRISEHKDEDDNNRGSSSQTKKRTKDEDEGE